MNALLRHTISATRTWTALYTSGLPAHLREERREEIDCDLWEHQHLARLQRIPETATAREILLRFLMGIPADCIWRIETGAMVRSEKRNLTVKTHSRLTQLLTIAAILVLGLVPAYGLRIIINALRDGESLGAFIFGVLPILAGVAILTGLLIAPSRATRGLTLTAVGCVVLSLIWFWMFPIMIPLSIALIALSYYRGKQAGRGIGPQPA